MTSDVIFWRDGSLARQRHARTPAERVASGGFGAPPVVVFDFDESKHPRVPAGSPEGGRFGEGDGDGKRKEGEGTGTKDDPIYTKHPKLAVKLLGEGKYVELDQPRKVSTMLDRISKIVADAQKHGEQAPTYNLCHASVAGTNLFCEESKGIPRVMMPQLKGTPEPDSWADKNLPKDKNGEVNLGPAFIDELRSRGIATESTTAPANVLRATQNELDGARVAEVADKLESGKKWAGSIYATSDDYIVDGHHHWAADIGVGYHEGHIMDVNVQRIDAPILQVLAIANNFTESRGLPHKTVGDNLTASGDWDESKHPRGGDPANPGRFSPAEGDAGGGLPAGWTRRETTVGAEHAEAIEASKMLGPMDLHPSAEGITVFRSPDGNVSVRLYDKAEVTDQRAIEVAHLARDLYSANPTDVPLTVDIVPGSEMVFAFAYGQTFSEGRLIQMNATSTFVPLDPKNPETQTDAFGVPATVAAKELKGDVSQEQYTLTHEYGHALMYANERRAGRPGESAVWLPGAQKMYEHPVTNYGDPKYSHHEAYAEAFADFRLAQKPADATLELAKHEGWK